MTSHSIEGLSDGGLREKIARIIDPSKWAVLDGYLRQTQRLKNAGYDPDNFKDKDSLAKADAIIALSAASNATPAMPSALRGLSDEPSVEAAYREFPDITEPVEDHAAGRVTLDRGAERYGFLRGVAYARALSAAPERVEGGGWEPIESAPKTGERMAHILKGKISRGEVIDAEALDRIAELVDAPPAIITDADRAWAAEVVAASAYPPIGAEGGRATSSDGSAA